MSEQEFEIDPEAGHLIDVLRSTKDMNTYDYNKMMTDFEAEARHKEKLGAISKHWANVGRSYRNHIKRMKQDREEQYFQKLANLEKRQRTKQQTLITALTEANKKKEEDKKKNIQRLIEREEHAKRAVEENLLKQEDERLRNAENIHKKIEQFKERNLRIKEIHHIEVVKKNYDTEVKHTENLRQMEEEQSEIDKENEKKAFQKYVKVFFKKREEKGEKVNKYKKAKEKLELKEQRIQELELKQEEERKSFIKRLRDKEKKKEELDKEKAYKLERKKMLTCERFERVKLNKEEGMKFQLEFRQEVIAGQLAKLERGYKLDDTTNKRRINAGEKIVLNNMIFEKNLPMFRKKMNHLQSESVLKKSPEEKRGMFLEKKRLEEEQRKKEEEEKKLAKQ